VVAADRALHGDLIATLGEMGSSRSKPRKGHEQQHHLAKVGTPANRAWEHEEHRTQQFGSNTRTALIAVFLVLGLIGLLVLTL